MSAKDKKALVMKRKKGRFNKGGLFGAMMADSDSNDSDEEEDDDEGNRDVAASNSEISNCGKINNASKKKKKRKNKKKNKNNHGYDDNDDAFLDAAVATNAKEAAKVKNKETLTSTIKVEDAVDGSSNIITLILSVLSLILSVLSQYIIPMILAVLTWLVTVLFGNKSKKKNKLT